VLAALLEGLQPVLARVASLSAVCPVAHVLLRLVRGDIGIAAVLFVSICSTTARIDLTSPVFVPAQKSLLFVLLVSLHLCELLSLAVDHSLAARVNAYVQADPAA
jgi:hypothetical protein